MSSDKVIEIGAKVAVWVGMGLAAHVVNKAVDAALDQMMGKNEGEWTRVIAKSLVWGGALETARQADVAGWLGRKADRMEADHIDAMDAEAVEAIEHVDAVEGRGAVKHTVTPTDVGLTKPGNDDIQLRKKDAQAAFPQLDGKSNPGTDVMVTTSEDHTFRTRVTRYNRTDGMDRYNVRGAGKWAADNGVKPGDQVMVRDTSAMQSLTERAQAAV